ncbi:MAG: alpha/beta fold hydrolase [Oligoflexia bacterium]|nr:alpha/beta fold hydrolase [Oligoflexia bacterium]
MKTLMYLLKKSTATWISFMIFTLILFIITGTSTSAVVSPTAISSTVTNTSLKTKYPIVMVHGIMGFDTLFKGASKILKSKSINYFFNIIETLSARGAKVYAISMASSASSDQRERDLIDQIKIILEKEKVAKVHLICHSQGGITARHLLKHAPYLLASVTTVASPHMGSAVADYIRSNNITSFFKNIIYKFLNLLGLAIETFSGNNHSQDSVAAVYELSSIGSAQYNELYPTGLPLNWRNNPCDTEGIETNYQGVYLFSWNAIRPYNSHTTLDPADYLLKWSGKLFISMNNFDGELNDGLVGKCSSYFGQVINKDPYNQNHLEEINLSVRSLLGLPPAPGRTDPMPLYISHVKRLQSLE